mgnify:CR=1 FL=1
MKILTVLGARPQFIKASPISSALKKTGITEIIINTGQHYDYNLSEIFFKDLNIPKAKYNLNIGSNTHGKQTGDLLIALEQVLIKENPDAVIVYGDTNSTLGGAIASSKLNIPVIHIEAGLRSFNKNMPEEINRIITDHVSDILFCPSNHSKGLLSNEGIVEGVHVVGDVMYDIFKMRKHLIKPLIIQNDFVLLTMHRAENTTITNLKIRLEQLRDLNIQIIYPIHPRTKNIINKNKIKLPSNISLIDPLSYLDLFNLASASEFIITDSGGLQKEALWLKKYCITIREETEWVETLNQRVNHLVGLNESININLNNGDFTNPYGDGNASKKIISIIKTYFN